MKKKNNKKTKQNNKKQKKRCLEVSSFYTTSVPKIMIICFTVSEIWRVMDVIVIFHCGLIFENLKKTRKKKKTKKNT